MTDTVTQESFTGLLARARSAFSADPSYAITMAQQAHIVRARRTSGKADRDDDTTSDR